MSFHKQPNVQKIWESVVGQNIDKLMGGGGGGGGGGEKILLCK